MFGESVAEIKKWEVFYNTTSDFGEIDLEGKVNLLQNHTSLNKVGSKKVNYFEILLSAKERYTKVETSGNNLRLESEGKDGNLASIQVSSKFGKKDGLPRYEVSIDGCHYKIIPKKNKKEKQD